MFKLLCALTLLFACAALRAAEAPPAADDPVLEARLMHLAGELRCLVCQNQSLADSHADLAVDLRNELRAQMKAGKSDEEIRAWMTHRYGDFVLYRPPVKSTTLLLWTGPFLLLLAGASGLALYLRRRGHRLAEQPLNDAERARARDLLRTDDNGSAS